MAGWNICKLFFPFSTLTTAKVVWTSSIFPLTVLWNLIRECPDIGKIDICSPRNIFRCGQYFSSGSLLPSLVGRASSSIFSISSTFSIFINIFIYVRFSPSGSLSPSLARWTSSSTRWIGRHARSRSQAVSFKADLWLQHLCFLCCFGNSVNSISRSIRVTVQFFWSAKLLYCFWQKVNLTVSDWQNIQNYCIIFI